jgi:hypothetical protein
MGGTNPFDRCVKREEATAKRVEQTSLEVHPLRERMRQAQLIAEAQKELTDGALSEATQAALKEIAIEVEPAPVVAATIVKPVFTASESTWTPHKAWIVFCALLWVIPSIGAFANSPIGGALVAPLWGWVCLILTRLPDMARGAVSDGGRNNRGAAV